ENYRVVNSNGSDLGQLIDRESPDLVILGVPSSNGVESPLNRLKDNIRYAYIPVISIADAKLRGMKDTLEEEGYPNIVFRPLNTHKLVYMMNEMFGKG
ncbi:MAG: hypothetical protein D6726_12675, partial [Nitrospirae bacterium]